MSPTDRRNVMRLAIGAAIAPLLVPRTALAREANGRIAPPEGPMIYRRRLERHLPGGYMLAVTRSFAVRFVPLDTGFLLEGRQVSVEVDAPENLAEFAAIEERRVEGGIFPLELDPAGRIVEGASTHVSAEIENALRVTNDRLDTGSMEPAEREEAERLVEAVHRAGAEVTTKLPNDLFAPAETDWRQQQEIPLPWGETGEVVTVFTAERDPETGLMRRADREVVTDLAGDRRRTLEHWELVRG